MISILQRYIAKTVIFSTVLIVCIVAALAFFINFLGELQDIGSGDYGILQAAIYAFFELPHTLYQFFPMMILLGGLFGLGMLASHSELIIMRTTGLSIGNITRGVFLAAIVLMLMGFLLGELLAPHSHFLANKQKSAAKNGGQAVATKMGVWVHEGNNFLHIDRVMNQKLLEGVTRFEFNNNHQLLSAYHVKSMSYKKPTWQLNEMVQTVFLPNQTKRIENKLGTWNLTLNPNLLSVGISEPDEMALTELRDYTRHLESNGLQTGEFEFNFWKRVFQPLTMLIMLLLAIPFVFATPRSVSIGWRMLLGVIVGFIFYIFVGLLGQMSVVFQIPAIIAALLPLFIFAFMGYCGIFWIIRKIG